MTVKIEPTGASLKLSGKESTCQCRRHEFDPWSGWIPHAVDQLSPRATTVETVLWSPRAELLSPSAVTAEAHGPCSPCSTRKDAFALGLACNPRWPQLEKGPLRRQDPTQLKNKYIKSFFGKRVNPKNSHHKEEDLKKTEPNDKRLKSHKRKRQVGEPSY